MVPPNRMPTTSTQTASSSVDPALSYVPSSPAIPLTSLFIHSVQSQAPQEDPLGRQRILPPQNRRAHLLELLEEAIHILDYEDDEGQYPTHGRSF